MKISYFEETDSAYIEFKAGVVADETIEFAPDINVDMEKDGNLIGIEIVSNAKAMLVLGKLQLEGVKSVEVVAG